MTKIYPPTVADAVRRIRETAGETQLQLANRFHCTQALISQIEKGHRRPTPEFCAQLAEEYGVSRDLALHLNQLLDMTGDGARWDVGKQFADYSAVLTPAVLDAMKQLGPHAAAILDPRWKVLAANDAYWLAYPGLEEAGDVLTWFFEWEDQSRQVMLDWQGEAELTVRWFRALMAAARNPDWCMERLERLAGNRAFRTMWDRGEVAFDRHQPLMHLWDPRTDEPYSLNVQITRGPAHLPPTQRFHGFRGPYEGGKALLEAAGRLR